MEYILFVPELSIIIPTFKRADILVKCLEHIERQTMAKRLQVIVVSDGHDDATADLMTHILQSENRETGSLHSLVFLDIPKTHQGVARNRGLAMATAPRVLFIGDDIFLEPDACAMHVVETQNLASLQRPGAETAVLGFTTWDPALKITRVMRWLEKTGWQFGYPMIEQYAHGAIPEDIQYQFTYTSHLSLPTETAKAHMFREDVSLYGWEDVEWGMRLRAAGVKLVYEPDAKALHHHPMTLEQSLQRMETLGRSAVQLEKIVPAMNRVPHGFKRAAYQLLALLPTMRGKHAAAFLKGIAMEERQR